MYQLNEFKALLTLIVDIEMSDFTDKTNNFL